MRLVQLAERHTDVRLVTENWHALLPHAAAVNELLDRTGGRVGFLIDLGNWSGPGKYGGARSGRRPRRDLPGQGQDRQSRCDR